MSQHQPRHPTYVVDRDGRHGTIVSTPGPGADQVLVDFENNDRLLIARELLHKEADDLYRLQISVEELKQAKVDGEPLVIPVLEEHLHVERVTATNRVQVTKTVHERIEVIDEPLLSEEVEIERVPVNRQLNPGEEQDAAQIHHEGEVLIIPLVEEVLFVEKRLMLREEVRIRKLQHKTHMSQEVQLRSEQVDVTRTPEENNTHQPKTGRPAA